MWNITLPFCASNGPYELKEHQSGITVPSTLTVSLERVRVLIDVDLTLMHRSYWSSYCCQGTGIDWNTGRFAGITTTLPTFEMVDGKNEYEIGFDCMDCYGSFSDGCLKPVEGPRNVG